MRGFSEAILLTCRKVKVGKGRLGRITTNDVRSFILVSRLPSHQIADGRAMQMEVSSYLMLSITIFLKGINDLRISFPLIQYHSLRKYSFEARSIYILVTKWIRTTSHCC